MNLPPEKALALAQDMASNYVIGASVIGTLKRECWNRGIDIADNNRNRMEDELIEVLSDEFAGGPKRRPRNAQDFVCPGEMPEKDSPDLLCSNRACPYADYCNRSAVMVASRPKEQ